MTAHHLSPQLLTLLRMISFMRPHGSIADDAFRKRYLRNLPGATIDAYRNIHVRVGQSRVLWSSHTDTVHWESGIQRVVIAGGRVCLPAGSQSTCLGADDTVGVWLMREMILARVPGHYVFHYGEESGGIGSSKLAARQAAFLERKFDAAIALDRGGCADIITHQTGQRCCSDTFAYSLAAQLGTGFEPSSHGVYTDTAEYVDSIPECTNVSIGYTMQHTSFESVSLAHVFALRTALLGFDETALVIEREPGTIEYDDWNVQSWEDIWKDKPAVTGLVWDSETCGWVDKTSKPALAEYVTEDEDEDERDSYKYLDPQYAEVQRALRNGTLHLLNNHKKG